VLFLSAEYLSVGDSTVLVMMSPMIAAILGYLILGEPWRLPEFAGTILSLVGATLVAKPPFIFGYNNQEAGMNPQTFYLGVFFALSSAVCAGFAFIFIRMLGTSVKMPWANVCFSQALGQIFLSPPSLYLSGQKIHISLSRMQYLLIFAGGFIGAWSQIAMTVGMQREKSATATAMRMSDVVFGFMWQILFTPDVTNLLSIFGAILVASSILVIVIFKRTETIPTEQSESQSQGIEMKNLSDQKCENNAKISWETKKPLSTIIRESLQKMSFQGVRQQRSHSYRQLAQHDAEQSIEEERK